MKKRIAILMAVVTIMGALAGCGAKVECDFCGDIKRCTTKSMLGEEINVCDDCMDEINSVFK